MKFVVSTCVVRWSQGTAVLTEGQSAEDDHPLVKERPDLFRSETPAPTLKTERPVERATRRPGEKRGGPIRG